MRHAERDRFTTCDTCTSLLLILSFASSSRAFAQDIFPVSSSLATRTFVTMPPTANLESMSASTLLPITPVMPVRPPLETYPELFIATEQTPAHAEVKNRVFNYYFLFLALLAAVLAALLWWMHRQRRRGREEIRLRGQNALVRDVERWAMYRRRQSPVVEGLDESGQAPPPYKPKEDTLTTLEPIYDTMDGIVSVSTPPRALPRDETDRIRLPGYSETNPVDNSNMGAPAARPTTETASARASST